MIVLVAGMPRSGSTFSFNVVRELLQVRGGVYQEPCEDISGAVRRSASARHVLVKAHGLDEPSMALAKAGAARIVITVRRVEDAMASWLDIFDELPEAVLFDNMRSWLRMFRELRGHSPLILDYAQIDRRPWLAAWRIARAVCPDAGPAEVFGIARTFSKRAVKAQVDAMQRGAGVHDAGWTYWDKQTFFHRRHVSAIKSRAAEERLAPEHLTRIREALANDIAEAGLKLG